MTAAERCRCPVISAVHGACIGAGVDLCTACDLRYSTSDAQFCVKEVDLAITADMGTLQRLPGIIGDGESLLFGFLIEKYPSAMIGPQRLKHTGATCQIHAGLNRLWFMVVITFCSLQAWLESCH